MTKHRKCRKTLESGSAVWGSGLGAANAGGEYEREYGGEYGSEYGVEYGNEKEGAIC